MSCRGYKQQFWEGERVPIIWDALLFLVDAAFEKCSAEEFGGNFGDVFALAAGNLELVFGGLTKATGHAQPML